MSKDQLLFDAQSGANMEAAKEALVQSAVNVVTNYVKGQKLLTRILVAGRQKCTPCAIDKITKKLAKLQQQVGEINQMYKLLFHEEIDIPSITKDVVTEHFPVAAGLPEKDSSSRPEIDEIGEEIQATLRKMFPNANISVVGGKVTDRSFGLDPRDYKSFPKFFSAVKGEVKKWKEAGKSDEEIIAELHKVPGLSTVSNILEKLDEIKFGSSTEKSHTPITDKAVAKVEEKQKARAKKAEPQA